LTAKIYNTAYIPIVQIGAGLNLENLRRKKKVRDKNSPEYDSPIFQVAEIPVF